MSSNEIGVYGSKEAIEQIFDEKHYKLKKRAVVDERGNVVAEWVEGVEERSTTSFVGRYIDKIEKKKQLSEMHIWMSYYKVLEYDPRTKTYAYRYRPIVGITVKSIDGKARILLSEDDLKKLINALRRAEYWGKKISKAKDTLVKF